jgi:hypothetical protein
MVQGSQSRHCPDASGEPSFSYAVPLGSGSRYVGSRDDEELDSR